jgi:hypothetical protein
MIKNYNKNSIFRKKEKESNQKKYNYFNNKLN